LLTFAKSLTRRQVIVPVGFTIGALFGAIAIRDIDWTDIRIQIGAASPVAVLIAVALTLVSAFIRAFRWRLMFVGQSVRTLRLFLVENAALGLNNVSPLRLLDEPAILTMLTLRDRIPAPLVMATLVMTRIQDLGVTLLFAAVALAVEPTLAARVVPALVAGGAFVLVLGALLNLGWLSRHIAVIGRIPGINLYGQAVATLLARKIRLTSTVLLTGAYWLVLGPMTYLLADGMGVELSMLQATILIFGAIFFATAVPGLPAALGTFELAVVELASIWDVPQASALGFGLILHLVVFLPSVIIAAFVLPREGFSLLGKPSQVPATHARNTPNDPAPQE
jgi:glycosyltransferase 2 family protein